MIRLYHATAYQISRVVTRKYSTSFYIASRLLDKCSRDAIFSIYGFVRLADEIVDSFHDFDKKLLLDEFERDFYKALNTGISLNPVLHAFALTVKIYKIPLTYVDAFLKSMKYDLYKSEYRTETEVNDYIYGSADVVGLMCLRVFYNGNETMCKELETAAMKLGSAFQKVNFLRDLKNDTQDLGRSYFPELNLHDFNEYAKMKIINDIEKDFFTALTGIRRLPHRSRLAVLIAFYYYKSLLNKLKKTPAREIIKARIRVSDPKKMYLLAKAALVYKLNLI